MNKKVLIITGAGLAIGFAEALVLLKATKNKARRFDFDYLGQTDIKERANKLNSEKFKEILRDYYLKEIT